MARIVLSWSDVEALLEHLLPQFYGTFDAMIVISRGGIIPGGLIAERLDLNPILTAAVHFPAETSQGRPPAMGDSVVPSPDPVRGPEPTANMGLPEFTQFPDNAQLRGKRTLVVHHIWNHGRSINAVAGRVLAAGGSPALCVLHYKPNNSIFPRLKPDFYAAVTSDYIIYPWEVMHRLEPYRPRPEPT